MRAEDNELLTRVGPGTPMGNLMREHWIPACLSSELPAPDGPPLRIRLLGENLVAFRATSGQVGLMADACPHRCASLFYGRNEENGLRCVYHGWKFDLEGNCVDMPSEPAEFDFKHKVKNRAYPCQEHNGVVFTYMGPRKEPPPLPELMPLTQPAEKLELWCMMRECNWLQALEGDIDVAHLGFLHLGAAKAEDLIPHTLDWYMVDNRAPRHIAKATDYGTIFGTYYEAKDDTYYWRIGHVILPFYAMISSATLGRTMFLQGWVPIDDHNTMMWRMDIPEFRENKIGRGTASKSGQLYPGTTFNREYLPNTTDWLGRWRLAANRSNDYLIDRQAQQQSIYTGIDGIPLQDQCITESMGSIQDRTKEYLGSSDAVIIQTRRMFMKCARELEQGKIPPTVDTPSLYRQRSGGVIRPRSIEWLEIADEFAEAKRASDSLVS